MRLAPGPQPVAVIPARGGSVRIPRKNIRLMSGSPLIAWPIKTALASGIFQDVVVSTDDIEIADVARAEGASIYFMRPAELSGDSVGTLPVVAHAIKSLVELGLEFDQTCCMYPAALALTCDDVARSFDRLMETPDLDFVATVTQYPAPVQEALSIETSGRLRFSFPHEVKSSTHDYEPHFYDAGQLYWGRNKAWLRNQDLLPACIGYELPMWRVQDIDTQDDWERAEIVHAAILAATPSDDVVRPD